MTPRICGYVKQLVYNIFYVLIAGMGATVYWAQEVSATLHIVINYVKQVAGVAVFYDYIFILPFPFSIWSFCVLFNFVTVSIGYCRQENHPHARHVLW